jgi:hypothetical protein
VIAAARATPADYARDLTAIPANMTANVITKAKARRYGRTSAGQDGARRRRMTFSLPQRRAVAVRSALR